MIEPSAPLQPRIPASSLRPASVSADELDHPTVRTVLKLIWNMILYLFRHPAGMIIGSAFAVLMVWGYHGNVDLLGVIWNAWKGPGSDPGTRSPILPGIAWDQELISFVIGLVVVVGVPCLLIRLVFKQKLSDYGLGLPRPGRWRLTLVSGALLLVASAVPFYLATKDPGMRATYPIFRGQFTGSGDFLLYELCYLPFFVVIEFMFRGYLLFGLFQIKSDEAGPPPPAGDPTARLRFGYYAILISMLSYTAWHLGKPIPELWSTLVWGLAAGTVALATGTIWHIVLVHWLLNVGMDYVLWRAL